MSPWVPVVVSAVVVLVGFATNAALIAFFLGKMKATADGQSALFAAYQESQKVLLETFRQAVADAVRRLEERLDEYDAHAIGSAKDRANFAIRLQQVEENTHGLRDHDIRFAKLEERTGLEHAAAKTSIERLDRRLENLAAQVANLARGGANSVYRTDDPPAVSPRHETGPG